MEKNIDESQNIYDIENEKFCSQKENKNNNKKESQYQIFNFKHNSQIFKFNTNSYSLLHGKLKVNLNTEQKRELVNKYWIIKPKQKYEFYSKAIKDIWKNESISKLKNLLGIIMVFRNFLNIDDINRFDNYFSVLIKSNERKYCNKCEYGKLLFIGGDLKCEMGKMLKDEFGKNECNTKDNSLPVYISIMVYDEYEKIESEANDLCDKMPEHNGFLKFPKIFHQDFQKGLSNKVQRIKREKMAKREKLRTEENKEQNKNNN